MAGGHQEYLAIHVINEGNIVNYRNLSRALKVHSNKAKEYKMLYDFYQSQTVRKRDSLKATYLVSGFRKPEPQSTDGRPRNDDGDSIMGDSSFMSSSNHENENDNGTIPIPVTSITLAREEDVETVKTLYDKITSIHIYSLGPGPVKNLQVISDCNRRVTSEYATEDPLKSWKQYGVIQNTIVKRRPTRQPTAPPAIASIPNTSGMKPSSSFDSTAKSSTKPMAKVPTLKKENSSIFASFAKSKSDEKKTNSQSSATDSPAQNALDSNAEDETMNDISEGDDDDAFALDASEEIKQKAEANRQAKKEREEKLRQMMEDDEDDPMEDPAAEASEKEAQNDLEEDTDEPQKSANVEEPQTIISDERRRGKRKVMKKKTTKDADGYLVTKEEAVWESFSEEEPEKNMKTPIITSVVGSKAKRAAKPGQGNIMSFFGKK